MSRVAVSMISLLGALGCGSSTARVDPGYDACEREPGVYTLGGAGPTEAGYVDGAAEAARFDGPMALTLGPDNALYVADELNQRIRRIQCDGCDCVTETFAGTGVRGYLDGPALESHFRSPVGITYHNDEFLVVEFGGNRIRRVFQRDGEWHVDTLAGNGVSGHQDGPADTAQFAGLDGITVAADGAIYVAEELNFVVRRIDCSAAPCTVETHAGVQGQSAYTDGPRASAQFGLSADVLAVNGDVLVADWLNHRIRSISGDLVSTFAGSGDEMMNDGALLSAGFAHPRRIAVGPDGALYVADQSNHRIRKIQDDQVITVAGSGDPGPMGGGFTDGLALQAEFDDPSGLAISAGNRIFVADRDNNAIRVIVP